MEKIFTAANFQTEAIEASKTKPVLVDFFATWCGPCQTQGPIVEQVAEVMGDKAVVGKLDVDEAGEISGGFGVMSIPTIIILQNGVEVKRFVGVQDKADLVAELNALLAK